jgi:predicted DNA-binding transcriptional regulator AlpA
LGYIFGYGLFLCLRFGYLLPHTGWAGTTVGAIYRKGLNMKQTKNTKERETAPAPAPELVPMEGNLRAKTIAPFLGIALSTFWLYVKQGRVIQPIRYSKRLSVWPASYIRDLAANGIPEATTQKDGE